MWRLNACPRFTLPDAVSLNRLAAARFVLSFSLPLVFGFLIRLLSASSSLSSLYGPLRLHRRGRLLRLLLDLGGAVALLGPSRLGLLLLGREDLHHRHPFLPRRDLDERDLDQFRGQPVQDAAADLV